ncbi:MAG: P-loop NTPase, partial [Rhodospirillaceae bacterium]
MTDVTQDHVLKALDGLLYPPANKPVTELGWVESVSLDPGEQGTKVSLCLAVPQELGPKLEPLRRKAEELITELPGVERATAILTAQAAPGQAAPSPTAAPSAQSAAKAPQAPPGPAGAAGQAGAQGSITLPGITHVVAVSSGKGGVGKSTTTANLALAMAAKGLKVGVFDADIFGPSMPRMFGVRGAKPQTDGAKVLPVPAHGLSVMSIGFLVKEDDPVVWRGPMVMGALEQLLRDSNWGDLDILLIDMPPGTGDTQLTISQRVRLSGAIIVSTPQDIALLDARKGLNMFKKVNVPILGVIENMSYYVCPSCGHRDEVFSHGGAKQTADELGAPFLGELPLNIKIRETAD